MRAGRLDRLITIQRKAVTYSSSGEPQETWSAIGAVRRSASYRPLRGDEQFTGDQIIGREQVEFRIRQSADVSGLSPNDRIVYPACSDESPSNEPATRDIYDILSTSEIGRREGIAIIAQRRADVAG